MTAVLQYLVAQSSNTKAIVMEQKYFSGFVYEGFTQKEGMNGM